MLQKVRYDLYCCLIERIRQYAGNTNIGNCHAVLDAVLFQRFHADQLKMVSCNFAELAEIFWRNKGAPDKVKFVEICNPLGILLVGILAFDGFDVFGMCKTHIYVIFKIIKNRNPILISGFHKNMITIIPGKPIVKSLDIRVDGRKGFLIIFGYPVRIGSYDGYNDNILVDIKSTADGVF